MGNTDDRRSSGLTGGRTEIEVVVGRPKHDLAGGGTKSGWSFGMNFRKTRQANGLSVGAGFRMSPTARDSTTDWQAVLHVPVGWEPYPLPLRPFIILGFGRRGIPTDGGGLDSKWGFVVPWPRLQLYLAHTGGFHYT